MERLLGEACSRMAEDLKPMIVKVSGSFDVGSHLLSIVVRAVDNDEIRNSHLRLFYSTLFYISIDASVVTYRFTLNTYSDPTFLTLKHSYILETPRKLLPDTGEVTREIWDAFSEGLKYTKDGVSQVLPVPEPFFAVEDGGMDSGKLSISGGLS